MVNESQPSSSHARNPKIVEKFFENFVDFLETVYSFMKLFHIIATFSKGIMML